MSERDRLIAALADPTLDRMGQRYAMLHGLVIGILAFALSICGLAALGY
jgi:hypothetical protein